jgi:polyphenol oxidase
MMVMNEGSTLQGNHGFRVRQIGWGEVLECAPLARVADHCFTTRDIDFRSGRTGAEAAWRGLARHLGVAPDRLFRLQQVHGVAVAEPLPRGSGAASAALPEADVIITNDPSAAVGIQTADCVGILVADRRRRAVAAAHAGWRGTAARAARVAVEALAGRFGSAPTDLIVAIGPSIGPCCYEVGEEVRSAFDGAGHSPADLEHWFERSATGRWRLNLWTATRDQLVATGVSPDDVHVAEVCTATELSRFFSYRREGASAGRLVAAIRPSSL